MKPVEEHCLTQRLNFRFFLFRSSRSVHVAMNTGSSSIRGSCSTCRRERRSLGRHVPPGATRSGHQPRLRPRPAVRPRPRCFASLTPFSAPATPGPQPRPRRGAPSCCGPSDASSRSLANWKPRESERPERRDTPTWRLQHPPAQDPAGPRVRRGPPDGDAPASARPASRPGHLALQAGAQAAGAACARDRGAHTPLVQGDEAADPDSSVAWAVTTSSRPRGVRAADRMGDSRGDRGATRPPRREGARPGAPGCGGHCGLTWVWEGRKAASKPACSASRKGCTL